MTDSIIANLYREWLVYIDGSETRDAFRYMVGAAACLNDYYCHPQFKGVVRDFRFNDLYGQQPFSLIVNQSSLLFYFRLPAVRSGKYSYDALQASFPLAEQNRRGEWKVRVEQVADAQNLIQFAGLK